MEMVNANMFCTLEIVLYAIMMFISQPLHNQTQFVADPPSIEPTIFPVH